MIKTFLNKDDVAGVVVLYNSSYAVVNNISTYINQIAKLYVIDNSPEPNLELASRLTKNPKIHYHSFGTNKGVATALNWGAERAVEQKYSILLTMDDDTTTPSNMIDNMLTFWNKQDCKIGILSGLHHNKQQSGDSRAIAYTLTSGNLLNLHAFTTIGGFMNDLFIDHVDHEYGLRLNQNGYRVIELTNIRLGHNLGFKRSVRIGSKLIFNYGTHSPIRSYYFARNGLYLAKQYGFDNLSFAFMVAKELIKRLAKTILLDDNSGVRIRLLAQGLKDGWIGKLGQYHDNEDKIRKM